MCEQARAVAERVGVDQRNRFIQRVDLQHHQHRAEDFLGVDLHVGGHTREQRRPHEVAALIARHRDFPAIQLKGSAFAHAAFDQVENALLRPPGNHRADVRARLVTGIDLEFLRQHVKVWQPLLRRADQYHHGRRHTTLPCCAKACAHQRVEGLLTIGVGQHDRMILGTHHCLHALAMPSGQVINVRADSGQADKRNGLDVLVRADRVHHVLAAMHHVEHARRHTRLDRQFDQQQGR